MTNDPLALLVDAVIALTLLEAVAIVAWWRRSGGGVAPRDVLRNLVAGVFLMLALRCAVQQAGAGWVLLCLAAAGAAHASDLRARWRRPADATTTRTPR